MVFTYTFSNDRCTSAIAVTTYESQAYIDMSYTGEGVLSGRTLTVDLSEEHSGLTKAQIRELIASMDQAYGND